MGSEDIKGATRFYRTSPRMPGRMVRSRRMVAFRCAVLFSLSGKSASDFFEVWHVLLMLVYRVCVEMIISIYVFVSLEKLPVAGSIV